MTYRSFSLGTSVSSTNKTDHHDITEILLKVTLSTISSVNLPVVLRMIMLIVTDLRVFLLFCLSNNISMPRWLFSLAYNRAVHPKISDLSTSDPFWRRNIAKYLRSFSVFSFSFVLRQVCIKGVPPRHFIQLTSVPRNIKLRAFWKLLCRIWLYEDCSYFLFVNTLKPYLHGSSLFCSICDI